MEMIAIQHLLGFCILGGTSQRRSAPVTRVSQPRAKQCSVFPFFILIIFRKWNLGLNTLCRGCSSHTTLVELLYPRGDKSKKVCTGYKSQPTKGLNLLKESECRVSVQIVLCISFFTSIIFKVLFSFSLCIISIIIIVFAPTYNNIGNDPCTLILHVLSF